MKVIIDITEEGLKYAKMLHMCGIADGFHEAIANGIPIIYGTELASLLIDMRINEDIHDCTFIIPRKGDNYINEVVVKRYKAKEALQQEQKSECEHDHEILKAHSDGANEVLDKIRDEIEHMIPCSKEALSMKLGVLEIINKYKAEEDKHDKS